MNYLKFVQNMNGGFFCPIFVMVPTKSKKKLSGRENNVKNEILKRKQKGGGV